MKTLYLDLGMGAEKEKLCAALYDLLADEEKERSVKIIEGLGLEGVSVRAGRSEKGGIAGSDFAILVDGMTEAEHKRAHEHHGDGHGDGHHHHEHKHRGMPEIREIVSGLAGVSDAVKADVTGIYDIVAAAEANVHGSTPEEVHFHEVGGMYAIASVASFCVLMDMLGDKEVYASPLRTGKGMIECAHGLLPVPAPATAAIIRDIPVYEGDIEAELTTPTGAAMVKYYVKGYGDRPVMDTERSGYGFGVKDTGAPDIVKAELGEDHRPQ